jgi:hypothetical protein
MISLTGRSRLCSLGILILSWLGNWTHLAAIAV